MDIRFRFVLLAGCAFSLQAAMVPGEPAPDLSVRDASGATVRLSQYRQKNLIALLTLPQDRASADWADSARRLAPFGAVVLLQDGPAATVLIDRTGIVRRVLSGHILAGADLQDFVALWQSGKTYFLAYCARCHGEEGDSDLCVDKVLTGVSQRLTPQQIRGRLRIGEINDREVLIRGEIIKRFQLEAILVYVGGL